MTKPSFKCKSFKSTDTQAGSGRLADHTVTGRQALHSDGRLARIEQSLKILSFTLIVLTLIARSNSLYWKLLRPHLQLYKNCVTFNRRYFKRKRMCQNPGWGGDHFQVFTHPPTQNCTMTHKPRKGWKAPISKICPHRFKPTEISGIFTGAQCRP